MNNPLLSESELPQFEKISVEFIQPAIEKILLETDCPYLSPESKKNEENQPSNVLEVAKKIASIKSLPLDNVISQTTINASRFFNLL